jgi:F-box/WD-40 domain protein 7
VWHIESGECLHVLVGHLAAVRCVQYDGRLVVSGAYDYMVKVWNPEREECLHTLQGHTNRVYSLQVSQLVRDHTNNSDVNISQNYKEKGG